MADKRVKLLLLFFGVPLVLGVLTAPAGAAVAHDLVVRLDPERHLLSGTDEITLTGAAAAGPTFFLAPHAEIRRLTVDARPADYRFENGRVRVEAPAPNPGEPLRLRVEYDAVFDDPVPEAPANTDNPGYGVTGIVGGKGAFLLAGAGWYASFPQGASRFFITVDAPEGIVAVTAGRSKGRKTEEGRTLSFWEVKRPADRLSLSAGRYVVTETDAAGIQVATYFSADLQPLSDRYIDGVKRYLAMYSDLFGPYPFAKFAVVENFFPTGYGFPSYTLMGGTVLRLPFIVETSLGHEVAHCWWGNGVRVDRSAGNWSEGLTTYVADYLYKEKESPAAAEAYRRQWLRNYAALVHEGGGFALSEFTSRRDRVSKVIGYDKSAMVFHMLRQILGDEAFWGGLRDVYAEKLFQEASWEDFRLAFEARAGHGPCCTLAEFFDQWIRRAGAPQLALENVRREKAEGSNRWRVAGAVVQRQRPAYDLPLVLSVDTPAGPFSQTISVHGSRTDFSVAVQDRPRQVVLDPEANVFRRLYPEEIPASVNAVKGAGSVTVVVSQAAGRGGGETARMLVRALGLSRARIVDEARVAGRPEKGESRLYVGLPVDPTLIPAAGKPVSLSSEGFSADGRTFDAPTDTFFGVFDASAGGQSGEVVAILHPVHPRFGPLVARKVAHYGKYSYLAFKKGQNALKGVWPVTTSPLIERFDRPA